LLKTIGRMQITADQSVARRRKVLADWVAHGHSEQELRALAKGPTPLAPTGQDAPKESVPPSKTKRR
jgi:hypothetical protein